MLHALLQVSKPFRRAIVAHFAIFAIAALAAMPAWAQRQSAMNLFPHDTLLFVRSANMRELMDRLKETGTGKMVADPQIKPVVDRVLGQVSALYADMAEGEVGIPWDELTELPKGEVAFGIVARPYAMPEFLLLVDQGGERSSARSLVDRALKAVEDQGREISKETIDGVEITKVESGRAVGYFERDGTIVASTDKNLLRHVLFHWDGSKQLPAAGQAPPAAAGGDEPAFVPGPTLDQNKKFVDIITQCRRPNDPPPNLILYADPIEMVRQFGRAEPGLQIALAFLPQLGLDGLLGVGGSLTVSTGQYDSLTHVHLLLQNPRAGILSMLAFETGDHTPQPWVPYETETYMTGRWNFKSFFARLASIVDSFRGEGFFERAVGGPVSQQLGIDFKTQIIDNLAGRVTLVTGFEQPIRLQGRGTILAVEVVDEASAQQTLQTIMNVAPNTFERKQFGRATYYAVKMPGFERMSDDERPMNPFFAILDKHLFVGSSINVFERIVSAGQGEIPRLADSQDYARVRDTLTTTAPGARPAVLMLNRPDLSWKFWYEMLQHESTRELIEQAAADNETVNRFAAILREGGLPPFEVLKKYLAPGGGILYDTDSGFHGVTFSLRNE